MYERYKNINWYKDLMSECLRANIFRPFGPQFGLKISAGGGGPRAPPLDPLLRCLLLLDPELQLSKFGQTQDENFQYFAFCSLPCFFP